MKLSEQGKDLIKSFEGLKLTAYLCTAGVPTIGYGHTAGLKKTDVGAKTITKSEAESLFNEDVKIFEEDISKRVKSSITQHQFDALVSFAYNVGIGEFKASTLLHKVNENPNQASIRNEFMRWVFSGGKRTRGLEVRRDREANHYFGI